MRIYLMAPEVQETQMRAYFVLFNRIPHAFCVLSIRFHFNEIIDGFILILMS